MVTAGVYLLLCIPPLIGYSSAVLILCIWIGAITTIFTSLIGLFGLSNRVKASFDLFLYTVYGPFLLFISVTHYLIFCVRKLPNIDSFSEFFDFYFDNLTYINPSSILFILLYMFTLHCAFYNFLYFFLKKRKYTKI